jgi:hypothetical protein
VIKINEGEIDSWSYIWGSSEFSVKKAYAVMSGHQYAPPQFSWIWKSSCQAKHKFFFWLLLHDRLNTRNLLGTKNFHLPTYACVTLPCVKEETLIHLFWTCPFANHSWDYICPTRDKNLSVMESIEDIKMKIGLPFGMDIIIVATWSLWIVRNNKIFNNIRPSFSSWKAIYLQELRLISFRMKRKHVESFREWLQNQV